MLVVVKMPHTKIAAFKLVGTIEQETIEYLNGRFGKENVAIEEDIIDVFESEWFKDLSKKTTLGSVVRVYRENFKLTQQQLAQKVGIQNSSYISDIENNRRPISKTLVKKFAGLFGVSPEMFI
jgi:DNA-binding XRE family transcriptional regulator